MKILLLMFMILSCGRPVADETPTTPAPKPTPKPGGEEISFTAEVQPVLKTFCSQCHAEDTFIESEEGFLKSKAATRIANGSMPQKQSKNYNQWGDAQRQFIAAFVAQEQ